MKDFVKRKEKITSYVEQKSEKNCFLEQSEKEQVDIGLDFTHDEMNLKMMLHFWLRKSKSSWNTDLKI